MDGIGKIPVLELVVEVLQLRADFAHRSRVDLHEGRELGECFEALLCIELLEHRLVLAVVLPADLRDVGCLLAFQNHSNFASLGRACPLGSLTGILPRAGERARGTMCGLYFSPKKYKRVVSSHKGCFKRMSKIQ